MFSVSKHLLLCVILYILQYKLCISEPSGPRLVLYVEGEPEYTAVVARRLGENVTLVCELRGAGEGERHYVWNYVGGNGTSGHRPLAAEPAEGPGAGSQLRLRALRAADSGHYMCSAPPFSVTKYLAVQTRGPIQCARGAFRCAARCVLAAYVCDGSADCVRAEDEAPRLCGPAVCAQPDKLNCSGGRCIPASACCGRQGVLCRQPACCGEHFPLTVDGYAEAEYPPLFEDRRAPDDYGFIQSTIYTVTACALIFMIAVVLLVSAVCKMQMKRAALRGYSAAQHAHYTYHQPQRFPPCYETSRLLEQRGSDTLTIADDTVPTVPPDVELRPLPPRGPPVGTLTLQVGRFQLSLPRFPRPPTPTLPSPPPPPPPPPQPTYSRNGRTIRLLGAAPPPYSDALRWKVGPPPAYLSREGIDRQSVDLVDVEATSNIELPPCYDELTTNDNGTNDNGNNVATSNDNSATNNDNNIISNVVENNDTNNAEDNSTSALSADSANGNNVITDNSLATGNETLRAIMDNLPAIDSDVNANEDSCEHV